MTDTKGTEAAFKPMNTVSEMIRLREERSKISDVDVLYVTYAKDSEWFRWSLEVLARNLVGVRDIHVVMPKQDYEVIMSKAMALVGYDHVEFHPIEDWPGKGYYWQQWVKMNADQYSDAPFIMHIDSDVFVKEPCDVKEFFVDGKPSWLWAFYTDLEGVPWRAPTEAAVKERADMEFMQGFPFILDRRTYGVVREEMEKLHGMDIGQYAHAMAELGGNSLSEFNLMGHLAWKYQRGIYHWVDRNRDKWPSGYYKTKQFWSRSPINDNMGAIQQMLHGGDEQEIRTTERGVWVLTHDTHISQWVEQRGKLDFDTPFLRRILQYVEPGMVVIDVGAFIGDHTEAYAKAVAGVDGGKVLAFEPNKNPYECLRRNMAGHGHVECINKGVGAAPGRMSVAQSPNAGASHLMPGDSVEIVTIDSYQLYGCGLIKVDAEGMEFSVLQGAWRTISCYHPTLVLEINVGALERNGVIKEDIYRWLEHRGYCIHGDMDGPQFDVICLHKDRLP